MKKCLLLLWLLVAVAAHAQNPAVPGTQSVQAVQGYYGTTIITATGTGAATTTLTIPAPTQSGFYNYICYLAFNASSDGVSPAVAVTLGATSSTNFNSEAIKFSATATANAAYDQATRFGEPATGCAKSTSPTTATTFVSPSTADRQYTWVATYYQAP